MHAVIIVLLLSLSPSACGLGVRTTASCRHEGSVVSCRTHVRFIPPPLIPFSRFSCHRDVSFFSRPLFVRCASVTHSVLTFPDHCRLLGVTVDHKSLNTVEPRPHQIRQPPRAPTVQFFQFTALIRSLCKLVCMHLLRLRRSRVPITTKVSTNSSGSQFSHGGQLRHRFTEISTAISTELFSNFRHLPSRLQHFNALTFREGLYRNCFVRSFR